MHEVRDYIEDGYRGHEVYLPTNTYGNVLDSIVVACVDILVVTPEGKFLLGKRSWHPQKSWWLFGGRMKTGETLVGSAQRLITDELNLAIDPQRFMYVTSFSAAWRKRAHPPINNGTHTLSTVFSFVATQDELDLLKLNSEYEETIEVSKGEITNGDYHPAIVQCVTEYIN